MQISLMIISTIKKTEKAEGQIEGIRQETVLAKQELAQLPAAVLLQRKATPLMEVSGQLCAEITGRRKLLKTPNQQTNCLPQGHTI